MERARTMSWLATRTSSSSVKREPDLRANAILGYRPSEAFLVAVDAWLEDGADLEHGIAMGDTEMDWACRPWALFPLDPKGELAVPVRGVLSSSTWSLQEGAQQPVVVFWEGRYVHHRAAYTTLDGVHVLEETTYTACAHITIDGANARIWREGDPPVSGGSFLNDFPVPKPKELRKLMRRMKSNPDSFLQAYHPNLPTVLGPDWPKSDDWFCKGRRVSDDEEMTPSFAI